MRFAVCVIPSSIQPIHSRDEIPPPDYLCPRCYVRGHYEEYCPTQNDVNWMAKMKKWNVAVRRERES